MDLMTLPVGAIAGVFVAAAAVLVVIGTRFAGVVDEIADRTGLGEAVAGALLLGATTSLPGLVTSVVAAWEGQAGLAVSNSLGGIAAQTTFLAVADLVYRRVNLEHAAASVPNLLQSIILVMLVSIVLFASSTPDVTVLGVHPATVLLVAAYGYGLHMVRLTQEHPMWLAKLTDETVVDEPDEDGPNTPIVKLWSKFAGMAAVVAVTGYVIARSGIALAELTPLSGSVVGGLFTSVASSLPELVTVIAAVRIGALTLAVSDIVGGNIFDVLFIGAADVAYREGSIYHALGNQDLLILALTLMLTAILSAGLVHRQRGGIGFEGGAIFVLYTFGFGLLFFMS